MFVKTPSKDSSLITTTTRPTTGCVRMFGSQSAKEKPMVDGGLCFSLCYCDWTQRLVFVTCSSLLYVSLASSERAAWALWSFVDFLCLYCMCVTSAVVSEVVANAMPMNPVFHVSMKSTDRLYCMRRKAMHGSFYFYFCSTLSFIILKWSWVVCHEWATFLQDIQSCVSDTVHITV